MAFGWFKRNRAAQVETTAPQASSTATQTATAAPETRRDEPAAARPAAPVTFPADKVAARAYEIWVRTGHPHGRDQQNWLDAEAELRAEYAADPGSPVRKPR